MPRSLLLRSVQNQVDAQLLLGCIAYDEHMSEQAASSTAGEATPSAHPAALQSPFAPDGGDKNEPKKLQTARHYFSKVLENANKNVRALPPGSLPLLARMAQDPALPSQLLGIVAERLEQPWLGNLNVFLTEAIKASKEAEAAAAANKTAS